jgi:hypothetical protein
MPQILDGISSVEQLSERVRELERRVAELEGQSKNSGSVHNSAAATPHGQSGAAVPTLARSVASTSSAGWAGFLAGDSGGIFPILGRAVLGFAGAFLLRAISESTSLPKLPVLMVAILYACFWMVWAIRSYESTRFASITYAITSAGILCPLVWESTVRFQVLPATAGAVVLVGFLVMTLVLADRNDLQLTPWITTLSVVITAIALIIATHELVPLTCALLAVALATETNACVGHVMTFRAIPAMAANFSVWLMAYVLAGESVPEGYRPASALTMIGVCALLAVIYGGSAGLRTLAKLQTVTFFEVVQAAIAFSLATFGIMRASQSLAAGALGCAFFVLAAICYWGTLSRFAEEGHTRNRRVFANAAAAFLLAATFLLLPANVQVPFLCLIAVLATGIYSRTGKLSLGLHASYYIGAAVVASPLPEYVANALAATVPGAPEWRVWTVAITAAICYLVGSHRHADVGRRRLLWIVPAAAAAFTATGLIVSGLVSLVAAHAQIAASHLSMIRTVVICAAALSLGIASRVRRVELGWVAYAAVGLGTLKMVFEDLRYGNPASLVVSFLFYGMVLILLPRMTRTAVRPQVS